MLLVGLGEGKLGEAGKQTVERPQIECKTENVSWKRIVIETEGENMEGRGLKGHGEQYRGR